MTADPTATSWNTTSAADNFELYFGYRDEAAYADAVQQLVDDQVASKISAQDPTLWGPQAESESSKRLAWVGLAETSRPLIAEIEALRADLKERGLDHVVLCGMGGSSLAPEVICATAGVDLVVLDSSDPDYVRAALDDDLEKSVVVVSSKSGGTVETDSQRRAYEHALQEIGRNPAEHIVVITDPGSPLDQSATKAGYRVFHADPQVGGRYSALTAFGLVPSGLAGADLGALLDEAAAIAPALATDDAANPGLRLGALMGVANHVGADKVVLADAKSGIPGFGDWAEQLIAESTGKDGKGILPVVVENIKAPNYRPNTSDEVLVTIGDLDESVRPASGFGASVKAPLGAELLLWEYATAVAGRMIGINPFDQPDVESAKAAARGLLDGNADTPSPAFTDHTVQVFATPGLLPDGTNSVEAAVAALLDKLDPQVGYLAVMAYLDRKADAALAKVRETLATKTGRPTTFGWGPRFLHSTGQYHKGGPPNGVFLQITTEPINDLDVPGRPFTFGGFIAAQAIGDGSVLADHGRPVLRLHITDHDAGLSRVTFALS
jgi:glucose-6-phosphate isomerase